MHSDAFCVVISMNHAPNGKTRQACYYGGVRQPSQDQCQGTTSIHTAEQAAHVIGTAVTIGYSDSMIVRQQLH